MSKWHLQIEWHTQLLHQVCSRTLRWHAWQRTWLPLDEAACTQSCHNLCIHLRAYTARSEKEIIIQIHQIQKQQQQQQQQTISHIPARSLADFSTTENKHIEIAICGIASVHFIGTTGNSMELCEDNKLESKARLILNLNPKKSELFLTWVSCVVFPEPVSPMTMTTWLSLTMFSSWEERAEVSAFSRRW